MTFLHDNGLWAAIFDVDGTLVDSMADWRAAPARFAREHGLQPDCDLGAMFDAQGLSRCCEYLASRFPACGTEDAIRDALFAAIIGRYRTRFPALPHALEYLTALREAGVRMCVLTANLRDMVQPALDRLGMTPYFAFIMACPEEGLPKTDPALFLRCAQRLAVPPERCVVFEDAPWAVKGAQEAGMRTVGICDDEHFPARRQALAAHADRLIDDYAELLGADVFPRQTGSQQEHAQ